MRNQFSMAALAVCASIAISSVAKAETITPGATYLLGNHPDGLINPPPYGLRLDELYNPNPGTTDYFSFDFEDAQSLMTLVYDDQAGTIVIDGVSWGGRDANDDGFLEADIYLGLYTIHFEYDIGVGLAGGDDDVIVLPGADGLNVGTIMTPLGDTKILSDKRDGNFSFRFGDEDNDLGHRGFDGISGWGWLMVDGVGAPADGFRDWLFTATLIPEPASLALLGLGLPLVLRRRRN